ncbi:MULTISPECIES: murein biosynthesis integral membrane protein MurJ [unclassified Massilia]|uniref:murein biosynthesis integral membrane protein MurJ n=1 Tax=unclassified Massilia TaxID=2609279 RepID=UPI001786577D|nr:MULTISPECIES: murein biosynthesis integral membrane protein MurJ [unclassified Massilia]MBD8531234.1 murein biosynthesis integral membrane protein MurJ [Massilia sp. CFBP 13647]MBD8676503.1 murein biosynthesis integral membrane protein MurJ [Massilia sp. CFBP 13721]
MNLLKTLAAISSMTMVSRVTGLLRESLFATAFGASNFTDAFNIAFRLPNLLRRLFAEGAFSQAFVPIITEYKTKHGQEATKTLVDHVATVLIWSTLLVSVAGIVAAPVLIHLIGGGLQREPAAFDAAVVMTRMMFPYIACMAFVALSSGILNTWRQFKIPAITPVLLNLSFIFAAVVLSDYFAQPIYAMAVGVCIGGVLQVALQIPSLLKIGMLPRLAVNPLVGLRDAGVHRMLGKMGPAVFAVAAAQISLLINTTIAASLAAGAVSALQYADRLMELPTALLGVALGTILLPGLAKANTEGDTAEYSSLLDWGLRLTFLLAIPAGVGLATLAEPMIATLFHYGAFDNQDVIASSLPLMAYSAGLLGFILVKTLAPAFFARQDVRTPVRIAVGVLVVTQLLNLVFVPLLGVAGLALSIGVGACINAAMLYSGLRKRRIYMPQPGWVGFFLKVVAAATVLGLVAWFGQAQFDWIGLRAQPFMRAGALLAIITASAISYFGVLGVLGFRPRDFKRRAK